MEQKKQQTLNKKNCF